MSGPIATTEHISKRALAACVTECRISLEHGDMFAEQAVGVFEACFTQCASGTEEELQERVCVDDARRRSAAIINASFVEPVNANLSEAVGRPRVAGALYRAAFTDLTSAWSDLHRDPACNIPETHAVYAQATQTLRLLRRDVEEKAEGPIDRLGRWLAAPVNDMVRPGGERPSDGAVVASVFLDFLFPGVGVMWGGIGTAFDSMFAPRIAGRAILGSAARGGFYGIGVAVVGGLLLACVVGVHDAELKLDPAEETAFLQQ